MSNEFPVYISVPPSTTGLTQTQVEQIATSIVDASLTNYLPLTGGSLTGALTNTSSIQANNFIANSTSTASSGTAIHLTNTSTQYQVFTGSGNQSLYLPDATTLTVGGRYQFNNNSSSGNLTIHDYSGSALQTGPFGSYTQAILLTNATTAGTWDVHSEVPSNCSWGTSGLTIGAASSLNSITPTQLSYLTTISSNVQTQLNNLTTNRFSVLLNSVDCNSATTALIYTVPSGLNLYIDSIRFICTNVTGYSGGNTQPTIGVGQSPGNYIDLYTNTLDSTMNANAQYQNAAITIDAAVKGSGSTPGVYINVVSTAIGYTTFVISVQLTGSLLNV